MPELMRREEGITSTGSGAFRELIRVESETDQVRRDGRKNRGCVINRIAYIVSSCVTDEEMMRDKERKNNSQKNENISLNPYRTPI